MFGGWGWKNMMGGEAMTEKKPFKALDFDVRSLKRYVLMDGALIQVVE